MDAPLTGAAFPGEEVRNVINLSVADNTIGHLCYFMAILADTHFRQAVDMKSGG
jgi:hypothetical protein